MWLFISFALALTLLQCASSATCPQAENIAPCFCKQLGNEIKVNCSRLDSVEVIERSLQGCAGSKIFLFSIERSTFDYIPYDLFKNVMIRELRIYDSSFFMIGKLGEPQFKGLDDSLEVLKFARSFTEENPLAYVSMGHLNRLATLEVRDSHVGFVNNHWFKNGPRSLRVLRFVGCDVTAVGHSVFSSLTELRELDLSDNQLRYMPRWALPEPALHLEELNLERNKFRMLPANIFSSMPNLKIVKMELNELTTIDESIWKPVWSHLEFVDIDYNPLICDKKIKWIYESNEDLEKKLFASCYQPFSLIGKDLHSLKKEELK